MEFETTPALKSHIKFADTENSDETNSEECQSTKPRLGYCEVCAFSEAKYTCPRCEVKSCSLKCASIHKKELPCDGSLDKTKFISIKDFSNLDLSSDYKLLEEITRSLEATRKYRYKNLRTDQVHSSHLYKLKKELVERKTVIKFLPTNFGRHQRNTTHFNNTEKIVYWHIEWIFPNAESLRLHDEKVREDLKLGKAMRKYFNQQEDPVLQEKLQFYQSAGITGSRILLRAEGKSGYKFYDLDPNLSLKDCFKGKIIIEYPIIEVILKGHKSDVTVIDSDDEFESSLLESNKFGSNVVNKIVKKSESDENIYKAMKNLLFISEHSDGELSE